jgi:hypothetical protein
MVVNAVGLPGAALANAAVIRVMINEAAQTKIKMIT